MMFPVSRRIVHLYPGVGRDVLGLARRGQLLEGPHVAELETAFAVRVGTRHAVATATGRLALRLLLEGFRLPAGS